MNMNCINSNEIMNVKLAEKQSKVLAQIDEKLNYLFEAMRKSNPSIIGLITEEEVVSETNKLTALRKQCANLNTFGQVDSTALDNYCIDYRAD